MSLQIFIATRKLHVEYKCLPSLAFVLKLSAAVRLSVLNANLSYSNYPKLHLLGASPLFAYPFLRMFIEIGIKKITGTMGIDLHSMTWILIASQVNPNNINCTIMNHNETDCTTMKHNETNCTTLSHTGIECAAMKLTTDLHHTESKLLLK